MEDKKFEVDFYVLEELVRDAARWRWLRMCGGWPESEAAMIGAKPEEFDALADGAIARNTYRATVFALHPKHGS